MTPFTTLTSAAAVLLRDNIDTDQIIPARFLRKPRGDGYHKFLFHDARAADPQFPVGALGNPAILITGQNFGCGSSREGAVYALVDAGIRCVIGRSFGDIFAANASKNGLLTIMLAADDHAALVLGATHGAEITVDLPVQTIHFGNQTLTFETDPFVKQCLQEGLDDIALTLDEAAKIGAFEAAEAKLRPWSVPT